MTATAAPHPDPYRDVDAQPDAARLIASLEERGRAPSQVRLRRRFLRFAGIRRGAVVLEVGCGTGVVLRDLAACLGPRGRAVGLDPSVRLVAEAAARFGPTAGRPRVALVVGDGRALPFADGRFDAALAVTVLLHVADPLALVREMARVTRPGGVVAVQDQDFGTLAVAHPDRALTARVLDGVADRLYEEPWSGRRLPALLRAAGLERVRLRTDVYQDTRLEPYTRTFLERRAELAVRFGLVDAAAAARWLDGINAQVARGAFVFTLNFYGATGVRPPAAGRARPRGAP